MKIQNFFLNFKSFFVKLSFFAISCIGCFFVSELFLDRFTNDFKMVREFEPSSNDLSRHTDIYERYLGATNKYEIITIGDSFTNGGNVQWTESYPYRLFEMLDEKIRLTNLGICEDTSKGALLRLKDFISKRNNKSSKKLIVISLIGAADFFFEGTYNFEDTYKKIISNDEIQTNDMPLRLISNHTGFKTIKMFQYLISYVKNKFNSTLYSSTQSAPFNFFEKCNIKNAAERLECSKQIITSLKDDPEIKKLLKNTITEKVFFETLIDQIIYFHQENPPAAANIVGDLLTMLKNYPESLIVPETIYNIVGFGIMQNQYPLKEVIYYELKNNYEIQRNSILSKSEPEIDNAEVILKGLKTWLYGHEIIEQAQKKYLNEIIQITRDSGGDIIFMTYPRPYRKINDLIKKIAIDNGVALIDLESIFNLNITSDNKYKNLISDWEHCSPEGYDLIAKSVYPVVFKSISNLQEK